MTTDEAKARFNTVTSAEEMTDLMLECLRTFGPDGLEAMLIELKEEQTGIPFIRN